MSRKLYSADQIEEIIADYMAGMSSTQLAGKYGGSHRTILNVLERNGIARRSPGVEKKEYSAQQVQEIIAEYVSGTVISQIADKYGCGDKKILSILEANGVEKRSYGSNFTSAEQSEILGRWDAGEFVYAIAEALGRDQRTISKFLVDSGIDPSSRKLYGPENPVWRGNTIKWYRVVKIAEDDPFWCMAHAGGSGHVLEHRIVMARHLGRPLTEKETVHHKNGNRIDNRIENLQLRNGNHGNGVVLTCRNCGSHDIEHDDL